MGEAAASSEVTQVAAATFPAETTSFWTNFSETAKRLQRAVQTRFSETHERIGPTSVTTDTGQLSRDSRICRVSVNLASE